MDFCWNHPFGRSITDQYTWEAARLLGRKHRKRTITWSTPFCSQPGDDIGAAFEVVLTSVRQKFTAAVVGGGPAGSTAARYLAQAGVDVVLLEAKQMPRHKTCGGGIVQRAAAALPSNMAIPWQRHCNTAELHVGTEHRFRVTRTAPILSFCSRAELDHELLRAADGAGAHIWSPCSALAVQHQGNRVELVTTEGRFTTEFLIIADGALSPTSLAAGWRHKPLYVPALEWQLFVPDDSLVKFGDAARFDVGTVDPGYGWGFNKGDHLSVGVIGMRHKVGGLKTALARYVESQGITQIRTKIAHGGVVPVARGRAPLVRGRVMLAGDAAGVCDPLVGEGIWGAIQSGELAAKAIINASPNPWQVQEHYESTMGEIVLSELRAARMLARVFYGQPDLRDWLMESFGQELTEALTDVMLGKTTYGDALFSLTHWVRLLGRHLLTKKSAAKTK